MIFFRVLEWPNMLTLCEKKIENMPMKIATAERCIFEWLLCEKKIENMPMKMTTAVRWIFEWLFNF